MSGVRVLDLTDERAIYGVKLLADLGADVVRPEPPSGDPLRSRGPKMDANGKSLWHAFFASNRRFFAIDLDTEAGHNTLGQLVANADIVVTTAGSFAVEEARLEEAKAERESLVVVDVTSFGKEGPWKDFLAPDLIAGALGGAVATTGDVDTPPLKTFGELNFVTSGAYVAIAALAGLNHARETGEGQGVHVPVHHCIASCLEHVLMFFWYHDRMARPTPPVLPRRGSLHWSDFYVVMQAQGGGIMVTPTPNVDNQLVWLIEEGVADELLDPEYQEIENRLAMMVRMMEILSEWVATKDVEELFFEAQSRHSPYGWVLPVDKVAEIPQLEAREWWTDYELNGVQTKGPGTPYRFSETPWQMQAVHELEQDPSSVLDTIGWGASS